ncbi:MAG TPA: M20/M25/M40 family metallo-hydrolase [Gemmatimonadales bacterium]|nr:M20/M25/M40 family metallo-hydrolase [Gemmatimonadales bacterium]
MPTTSRHLRCLALLLLPACAGGAATTTDTPAPTAAAAPDLRAMLATLAHDSMEGRATGTPGSARAARWIEERMREYGLDPAVDGGYRQRVRLVETRAPDGSRSLSLPGGAADTVAGARTIEDDNVIGLVRGSDPGLASEAVVVGAHYDHEGIGPAMAGDSIYNGADDDGSGVVAVLAAARALAAGPAPRRTVVFLLTTGEEQGVLGTFHYVAHPVVPLANTVADLQVEMIGRPDSLAGGPGKLWLTGFERSTMGERLAAAGVSVVADPRPSFKFFERSDNIVFAWEGVPAHTLSSYNLHEDYHKPSDEVERVDFAHLETAVAAITRAVRLLADGERPEWKPGGRPTRPAELPASSH